MRAVPGFRGVEHGDHQAGVASADAAGGLDVLRGRLGLAHHGHEAQPIDIHADRDHVGGEDDIEGLRIWVPDVHPAQVVGDVAGWLSAGQLDPVLDLPPVAHMPAAEEVEAVVDVVLDLHPGAAQDPQAVEVADQGPVGVLDAGGAVEFRHSLQDRRVGADEERRLAGAGGHDADVEARSLLGGRHLNGEERIGRADAAGGNCRTPRSNSDAVCASARRMVAVEAMTFGLLPRALHSRSTAVSYSPDSVPSGPEIRCSSSWMISSGGRTPGRSPLKRLMT